MHSSRLLSTSVALFYSIAVAQQSAWGQCGGNGWSGATTCVSGYTCVKLNDWYYQCQPETSPTGVTSKSSATTNKSSSSTSTASKTTLVTSTTTSDGSSSTGTATGPGTTLQSSYYWIRAVESPYFHYYLQSKPLYSTGTAVMGSYTTAGQFKVDAGQLVQLISAPGSPAQYLYANVTTKKSKNGQALAMSWSASKNTYGTFGWQGDGLTWTATDVNRPNLIAWYVCENQNLYINLGNYMYQTPSGCSDETIHYYNDSHANS